MKLLPITPSRSDDLYLVIVVIFSSAILCASIPLDTQCPDRCHCAKDDATMRTTDYISIRCEFDSFPPSSLRIPKVTELRIHCNKTWRRYDVIDHVIGSLDYPDKVETMTFTSCAVGELNAELFNNLTSLISLDISGGNLTRFDPFVFVNLQQLEYLGITGHPNLDLVSHIFTNASINMQYLRNITSLDLSKNGITTLTTRFFNVFRNIEYLNLQDNNISNLTDISFFELRRLREIILDSNKISEIPAQVFRDLPTLNTISLSNNNITNPVITLRGTDFIQSLDLSYNLIEYLPDAFFQGLNAIEHLNLAHNSIGQISKVASFAEFKMLTTIDLSHNRQTLIGDGYFIHLSKLERIDLSYNQIKRISSLCVDGVQNLQYLNLAFNQLINFEQFPGLNTDSDSPVVDVIMEGNPLDCDCNMAVNLFDDFNGIDPQLYPNWPHTNPFRNQRFVNWESLTCDRVHGPTEWSREWYESTYNSVITLSSLENPGSYFCDESECPIECTCYSYPAANQNSIFVTQCFFVNTTSSLPVGISDKTSALVVQGDTFSQLLEDTLPSLPDLTTLEVIGSSVSYIDESAFLGVGNVTILYLYLNELTNITAGVFRPLPLLDELSLDFNQIEHIDPGSFAYNSNLKVLYLRNNKLKRLPEGFALHTQLEKLFLFNNSLVMVPDSFGHLVDLSLLNLSYNMLTSIGQTSGLFDNLNLQYLYLNNNNLTSLSFGDFDNIPSNIKLITLSNNPWRCSCIQIWLTSNLSAIVIGNMTCITANGDLAWPLTDTDSTKFECPGPPTHDHFKVVLSVSLILVILLIVVTVIAIISYFNRITIRSLCLSRFYSRFPSPQPNNNVYKYDIYISYNVEDSGFVFETLKPKLESRNYKLYIRDIRAIGGSIHEDIAQGIEASNYAIVIVSQNYINSYLESDYEFNHIIRQTNDQLLLAIQLEDLNSQTVSEEMKQFIEKKGKHNKRCIKYNTSSHCLPLTLFWGRVFDQLPHPRTDLQSDSFDNAMSDIHMGNL